MDERHLEGLVRDLCFEEEIFVTRPTMPDLDAYRACLEEIWASRWVTNRGRFHERFEEALAAYLGAAEVRLLVNGTAALVGALHALGVDDGEVITTPFTFPATAHALVLGGSDPVFGDIDPRTYNLDPAAVERLITPRTRAILPVHVFGTPCDLAGFEALSRTHGIPIVYDGAHAFGVRKSGQSIALAGDITMLSFHATKPFSSVEGGALVLGDAEQARRVELWRNFGIADEETVLGVGTNGKLNELQAAYGLLQLERIETEILERAARSERYRARLEAVPGLETLPGISDVRPNHAYLPVRVDASAYGIERDELSGLLRRFGVHARKYFYPLVSSFPPYHELASARPERLPVAVRVASEILCLPLYGTLSIDVVDRILDVLEELHRLACQKGSHA